MDEQSLTIAIEDTARPFDPTAQALPDEAELDMPLDERPIGGLGVLLARESVDDLRYEYIDGRNRTIITVNRPTGAVELTEHHGRRRASPESVSPGGMAARRFIMGGATGTVLRGQHRPRRGAHGRRATPRAAAITVRS